MSLSAPGGPPVPPSTLLDGRPAAADALPRTGGPDAPDGVAAFETVRGYPAGPFRLGAHLDRLQASAVALGLPFDRAAWERDLACLPPPGHIRLNLVATAAARRVIHLSPVDPARVGAPVRVVSRVWTPPSSLPGRVKHTDRGRWEALARAEGVDEVLWTDAHGRWTESSRSNLFVVRRGVLHTHPLDGTILAGVTRGVVLERARALGIPVVEGPVDPSGADETWLCASVKELAPLVGVDGRATPGGGPVGAALVVAFRGVVEPP